MSDLARENILDHYENPRHQGHLEHADCSCEDSNPMCGDQIQIEVQFSPDKLRLADAAFTGQGCTISQAAASMLLEDSVGKPVSDILSLEPQQMLDLIGMPLTAARVKCALLGFKVLKDALRMQCK